jgi:hypothetical protein
MTYPELEQVRLDFAAVRPHLRSAGLPQRLIASIETKALRTGRKTTGEHATNRAARWSVPAQHPQYSTERDARAIFIILCGMLFEFTNAPALTQPLREIFARYLPEPLLPGSYKDSLLLESLDYVVMRDDSQAPTHGHSVYHLGHEDPSLLPRHQPGNIAWRTARSNLIQGNMTLREARIYLVKMIGRYFELGELDIV